MLGKTLIIDSLGIISGGRFSKEMIRSGENHSYVEACIFAPENENSIDGNIIISREIYSNGRNLCKINGRMVTVNELKNFMKNIIDIHGQNDNQTLMDESNHIYYLDSFIGKEISEIKEKYKEKLLEYNNIKLELKRNYGDEREKQRKLDLLTYQKNEIEEAKLKENEEEELEILRDKMINSEKIAENLNKAESSLNEKALTGMNVAIRALEKIENLDGSYGEKLENIRSMYYELEEIQRDLSYAKEELDFDEEERNRVEERIDTIKNLKRKYGNNILEIIAYKKDVEKEIETIENLEGYINELTKKQKIIENEMLALAMKMNEIRVKYACILEEKINQELKALEMKKAIFSVDIELDEENNFNQNGLDKVKFVIKTNIGEESKSLIKIASGGEISRIMLALKTVFSNIDKTSCIIFDEIDTGISGAAAKAVSEKMKHISESTQIIVITHLPVVAARADSHFYISKIIEKEKTKTKIKLLEEKDSICEIARMLAGNVTDASVKNAIELKDIKELINIKVS